MSKVDSLTPIARHGAFGTSPSHRPHLGRTALPNEADRIDPARVFGPRHCPGRDTFASNSKILRRFLQLRQNTSIVEQGCAGFSPGSANRCDQFTRHPGRTSLLPWPCLSCRYTHATPELHDWPEGR